MRDPDGPPAERWRRYLRVAVVGLMLVACAGGGVVGARVYVHELAVERADAISGYRVTGDVVSVLSRSSTRDGVPIGVTARVHWRDRDDRPHQQVFRFPADAVQQRTVVLWIDAEGQASPERHTRLMTVARAVRAGIAAVVAAGVGVGFAYLMVAEELRRGRRRSDDGEDLDREWAKVERRWRRQWQ
jgi:hypothetical protein